METNSKQFGLLTRFDENGISFLIGSQYFSDSFDYNKSQQCLEPYFCSSSISCNIKVRLCNYGSTYVHICL